MKQIKLTFWLIGFGCGIIVAGIIGTLVSLNVTTVQSDEAYEVAQEDTILEINDEAQNKVIIDEAVENDLSKENLIIDQEEKNEEEGKPDQIEELNTKAHVEESQSQSKENQGTCQITIPSYLSASEICKILEENGVVDDGSAFLEYIKERKKQTFLVSGQYTFQYGLSYEELLEELMH